ncbi:phosphatase 2C-like domain-containing protein [Aspergillus granulosus]|uniref:Phosphatase 2C-like domain-containing protein n=1 Tax=Aspergillus granulosus TaxID=176169 RepID=A0ABR4HY49_9EURO
MLLSRIARARPCRAPPTPLFCKHTGGPKSFSAKHSFPHRSSRSKSNPIKYTAITAGLLSSTGLWWLVTSSPANSVPNLSPQTQQHPSTKSSPGLSEDQVTAILSKDAYSYLVRNIPSVDRYDGAQIASNSPCEDTFLHGRFPSPLDDARSGSNSNRWMAWGVFDGHLGRQTADVLQRELVGYVWRRLNALQLSTDQGKGSELEDEVVQQAITRGFVDLDEKIFSTAMAAAAASSTEESLAEKVEKMMPAFAGSCALLSLFNPRTSTLHVACTGDSRAVLAQQNPDGSWTMSPLSTDQTGSNEDEISRVNAEHPNEPAIVRNGRVLGLMVSRAFGDGQWKWPAKVQKELEKRFHGPGLLNSKYEVRTPPYITAEPVVTSTKIEAGRAAFVILATDGLWDFMRSEQAVQLVGGWLDAQVTGRTVVGRVAPAFNEPFDFAHLDKEGVPWGFTEGRTTIQDSNAAVHLMRNALGGSHHELIAGRLAFEPPHSRRVRDDTTVQVVFFNMGSLAGGANGGRDGDRK